jgi:O-succinylbenzoate synthase
MTITHQQRDTIEITAMKGKAIASLLGTTSPLDDASREDLQTAFYALQCFFEEIIEALEAEPTQIPSKNH